MADREIKFRAWDKENQIMSRPFTITNLQDQDDFLFDIGEQPDACCRWNEFGLNNPNHIVMQFTGLHDKAGKEIYEGDLIKECVIGQMIWDGDAIVEECPIAQIYYKAPYFRAKQVKKGKTKRDRGKPPSELNISTYDGLYQWPKDMEVIGNIHETPDLLEKK